MNRDLLEHRDAAETLFGTAPADLVEPFEAPPSTLDEARRRAERIRAGLVSYVETRAAIAEAWARRDWRTLGYDNWEAYLGGEFGEELRRLAGPERRDAAVELRDAGMSTRAIGAALGASEATVRRDLAAAPGDAPATVTGQDGKTYPARKPVAAEKPEPAGDITEWRCSSCGHAWPIEPGSNSCPKCGGAGEFNTSSTQDTTDSPAGTAGTTSQAQPADGDSRPQDRPGPAAPPAAIPTAGAATPLPAPAVDDRWQATDVAADGTLLEGLAPGAEVYDYGTIAVDDRRLSVRAGRLAPDDAPMAFVGIVTGERLPLALSMLKVELLIRKLSAAHRQMERMAAADPQVWIARARRGIDFHALLQSIGGSTRCERSTRTGTTMLRSQAIANYQAQPCKRCWPPSSPTGD